MTKDEIIAYQADLDRFRTQAVGVAFFKFKNALSKAWALDTEDSYTDRNRASTKAAHEKAIEAEKELKGEIYKLLGWSS